MDRIRHLESSLSQEKDQFHSLREDLEHRDRDLQVGSHIKYI